MWRLRVGELKSFAQGYSGPEAGLELGQSCCRIHIPHHSCLPRAAPNIFICLSIGRSFKYLDEPLSLVFSLPGQGASVLRVLLKDMFLICSPSRMFFHLWTSSCLPQDSPSCCPQRGSPPHTSSTDGPSTQDALCQC